MCMLPHRQKKKETKNCVAASVIWTQKDRADSLGGRAAQKRAESTVPHHHPPRGGLTGWEQTLPSSPPPPPPPVAEQGESLASQTGSPPALPASGGAGGLGRGSPTRGRGLSPPLPAALPAGLARLGQSERPPASAVQQAAARRLRRELELCAPPQVRRTARE